MKNKVISIEYVKGLLAEAFQEVANDINYGLNEKLTDRYMFDFPEEYYRNSDGELYIKDDPKVTACRFDNIRIQSIDGYHIEEIEDGLYRVYGWADVLYNLTALHMVYYSASEDWYSDYDEYELSDGSDIDDATIHFEFILEKNSLTESGFPLIEHDFNLEVL